LDGSSVVPGTNINLDGASGIYVPQAEQQRMFDDVVRGLQGMP
jgi:hypothetical protein